MRAYIGTCLIGTFAFDKDRKMLEYRLFQKKPEEIALRMGAIKRGEILDTERDIAHSLKEKGFKEIVCDRAIEIKGLDCLQKQGNIATEALQSEFRKLAMDLKWAASQAEVNEMLTKVNILLSKERLKTTKSDRILMQAITTLDEADKAINIFSEKIREWYGLYFPEAVRALDSNEKIVALVADFCSKEKIKSHPDTAIAELVDSSAGMEFSGQDLTSLQAFSRSTLQLFEAKREITAYLEKLASEVIPNMSAVAGPLLGSRMLAAAGGLEKMSRMPSSTIQLLGAEKALFRHLRGEGKAPKYGLLFAHPAIQNARKEMKGKAARIIAAKLVLAARTDHFSKQDKSDEFRKDLEEKLRKLAPK